MPVWPGAPDLPSAPELEECEGTDVDLVARTKMGVGPDKVRQRLTAGIENWDMRITTDETGRAAFNSFYRTDCNAGATEFTWKHPEDLDGDDVTMRFVGRPRKARVGPTHWRIWFNVEILP